MNPVENGTVEASATTAHVGDLINLTITPDEDYEVDLSEIKLEVAADKVEPPKD